MQIRVNISYISAERLWDQERPVPSGINISTNVNIIGLDQREERLAVPFVVTINYNPSLAQINIKGQASVLGSSDEIKKVHDDYKNQRAPPKLLLQAITNAALVEGTMISRSLNIPPPIPFPSLPSPPKPDKERPSYVG